MLLQNAILYEVCVAFCCDSCFALNVSDLEFYVFNFKFTLNIQKYITINFKYLTFTEFPRDPFTPPPVGPRDSLQ